MIKKILYIMSAYAVVIGSIITTGVYIKDLHLGPMARLVAIIGLFIALFGVIFLGICYKGEIRYKSSSMEFKINELILQLHGYQIKLTEKKLFVLMLLLLILPTFVAGDILANIQHLNRLTAVGSTAITINGTEVVMPFPMTVTIDDISGPRYSHRSDHSPQLLEDYENLVYIGEQVGTRLMCVFIISSFDKTNICANYPTTTSAGKNWNNTPNLCALDEVIMQYVKNNSAYIEYGLHGVDHGMYEGGYLHLSEWYDITGNKPWNYTTVKNHVYVFDQISKQYNLSFPQSMVPPHHAYYYNPSSNESTAALLNQYGVKYVTTDFYTIPELRPKEGIDHGVLFTHREVSEIRSNMVGAVSQDIEDTTSVMTHFANFYAEKPEKPEDNRDVAQQWISWFNIKIKDNPYRYVPKNNAQLNSQWLYCKYTEIMKGEDNTIILDNSRMPADAYTYDLIGNLILKIRLPVHQHIAEATIAGSRQIAGYYEDRGYGYIILPILNRSSHIVSFKLGSRYLPTYVLNDGTYNVYSFNSTKDKVDMELEMYGTQEVKIKVLFQPKQILSNNPYVIIQSSDYDSENCLMSIRLTAIDVQGERTRLIITP